MVRRTKEEALATRNALLDTAEDLFQRRGVSRTSLHDIAQAAGLTRGAVYWHFKDKAALFNAMMERATMPLEASMQHLTDATVEEPLGAIRGMLVDALHLVATSARMRRVIDIAMHRMEYVDEQLAICDRRLAKRNRFVNAVEIALRHAIARGEARTPLAPRTLALGLFALVDGLMHNWLLDPAAFDLQATGTELVDAYLDGLRPAAQPKTPAHRRVHAGGQ